MPIHSPPWLHGYTPGSSVISASATWGAWSLATSDVVNFDVEEIGFNPTVNGNILGTAHKEELLLCAGLATSPATSYRRPGAWGFFVDHLESLRAGSGRLRTIADVKHWDSHEIGRFSDRMGMGLAAWVLWRHHDIVHIADAEPFIGKALAGAPAAFKAKWLKNLGIYGKNGKFKPDFFCLDNAGAAVIAEAKGAVGPPSALSSAITKGKEQVANVNPIGVSLRTSNNRLVLATNLRREDEKPNAGKDTALRVIDPEGDDDALAVPVTEDALIRHSYAKVMTLCNQGLLADVLTRGGGPIMGAEDVEWASTPIGNIRALPLLRLPGLAIGLELGLASALLSSPPEGFTAKIRRAVAGIADMGSQWATGEEPSTILLPNGVVAHFGATEY